MVEPPVEVVKFFSKSLPVVAEQVIEVPNFPLPDGYPQRVVPPEQQMAEQLVDVPTVHCWCTWSWKSARFLPGQNSSATAEQIVIDAVPRGRAARGGLQGFPQGRGASQRTVEQSVDIGLHPRHSSSQRTVEQTTHIPVPGRGGHQDFLPEQVSTAFAGAEHVHGGLRTGFKSSPWGREFVLEDGVQQPSRGRRFVGQVLFGRDAAGRDGFIESAQAELNSGGDFRFSASYCGRFVAGDHVWFSA